MATTTIRLDRQSKHLTSLSIAAGNPDGTGLITFGTAVDLSSNASGGTATFEGFTLDITTNDISLRAADSIMENMAGEYNTFSCTVSELAPANGIGNLLGLASGNDYFLIIAKYRPSGAASSADQAIRVVGKRSGVTTSIVQGKNVDTLSLTPCGKFPYVGLASAMPSSIA